MSLFGRLFGGGDEDSYSQGIALFEEGKFAEAIGFFRTAAENRDFSPVQSLASFYLRQALINESRRLIRGRKAAAAVSHLEEATTNWDRFPDLQFLLGAAQGLAEDWDSALHAAHTAGRLNADYCEARLLEACALQQLNRHQECAESLNALLESGRRETHWLINDLFTPGGYRPDNLPDTLIEKVFRLAGGHSQQDDAFAAAALCRAGRWEKGLQRFEALVHEYPHYPDYRVQYAATLFQLGRTEDALNEVTAALELNAHYRAAQYLRGLLLADLGRLAEARDRLADVFSTNATVDTSSHEDLLVSYLRATLEMLFGHPEQASEILAPWPDVLRSFARAELLRAAAEHFSGQLQACERRLAKLVEAWPAEEEFHYIYVCYLLWERKSDRAAAALQNWPSAGSGGHDPRQSLLAAELALAQTQPLPGGIPQSYDEAASYQIAGLFQQARALAESQDWTSCWLLCEDLVGRGICTEQIVTLQLRAVAQLAGTQAVPPGWVPPVAVADATAIEQVQAENLRGNTTRADELISPRAAVHPTHLVWSWLSAGFWIDPVRQWIG